MNRRILYHRTRFALIALLMTIVSLMFLFYMWISLVISTKKYLEQIRISNDVLYSRNMNKDIKKMVKGMMIESYIEDGNQKISDVVDGKSITDPCRGWEKTEALILELADRVDY